MAEETPTTRLSTRQLILVPAIITLGVTLLRLVGELQHWSKVWFNPEPGGGFAVVGIVWLAPVFGIYFALKLVAAGEGPRSVGWALRFAVLGVLVVLVGAFLPLTFRLHLSFRQELIYMWATAVLAAVVTFPGWPALFKALLAYAYAARIPVAIVMFFAFRGNWGTHYDALPPNFPALGLWPKYLLLGLFPQLIFWVGFTIVTGSLFGTVAGAIGRRGKAGAPRAS